MSRSGRSPSSRERPHRRGTRIGNCVTIAGHTEIGRGNTIYHNVVLGTPPQDLHYAGMETRLVIGDDNTIREFVTVNIGTAKAARSPSSATATSSWPAPTSPTTACSR